ncbi:MAG: heavy metal-responsive transcriptional regulator [Planctomycetota bacterium]|nr:MAG: heavy metal-responsive transcriptional regulator [Planctomycetota bacterium]
MEFTIGKMAKYVGISPASIRYYESIGLLPSPIRTSSGYRKYSLRDLERVRFIKNAQRLGFSLSEIGYFLYLSDLEQKRDNSENLCSSVQKEVRKKISELEEKIERLQELKKSLEAMLEKCTSSTTSTCPILAALGEGSRAETETKEAKK